MENKRKILSFILLLMGSFVFSQDDYGDKYLRYIKVLGWSSDGKVAVLDSDGVNAFILNTWNDKVLWEKSYYNESYGIGDVTTSGDYGYYDRLITDLRQACGQHGIAVTETSPHAPSGSSFLYKYQKYTIIVNSVWKDTTGSGNKMVVNYSVIAETGGKRKTIFSGKANNLFEPMFVGYSVSPFGERALIIIYKPETSGAKALDGSFAYIGCHLITGFR
jgi:hypothetical protein